MKEKKMNAEKIQKSVALSRVLARIKRDADKLPKWFKASLGRRFDVR